VPGPLDRVVRLYTAQWAGLLVNRMRVLRRGNHARTERLRAAENKKEVGHTISDTSYLYLLDDYFTRVYPLYFSHIDFSFSICYNNHYWIRFPCLNIH